jgi:hypothetical protein
VWSHGAIEEGDVMPTEGVLYEVPLEKLLFWHSTLKGLVINPAMCGWVGKDRYKEMEASVLQMEAHIEAGPKPKNNLIPWKQP